MAIGIDRRLVYNVDWVLLGASVLIALVGVSMVFSATHSGRTPDLYLKQLVLVGIGVAALDRDRGASTTTGWPTARCCSTAPRWWRCSTCSSSRR